MTEQQDIQILIADDHLIFRDALRKLLEAEDGFRVVGEATTGEEALDMAKDLQPDVLLLDLSMPQVPGLEVLKRLPKETEALHTILLTASVEQSEIIEGLLLGAEGVVPKHSSSEMLFKSIRTVMAGELWVSRDMVTSLAGILRGWSGTKGRKVKVFDLTRRELEIIAAVIDGMPNKDIAKMFQISEYTVKHHLTSVFDKVGVTNRVELATFAIEHDLVKHLQRLRLNEASSDRQAAS